ncbi:MAG: ATP-binding cassette domain-containing protein, partial [Armatimonadetes bacterium]|nr:ATP-binding cassette domain-containing protein [Armatimonadota bacterium]
MNQPIVQTIALRKTYNPGTDKAVEVLHGVDMQAFAGEFVAIIGQSGSGKSTLLNILGALDTPTSGQVLIDGIDIATLSSDGLASLRGTKIGFVFQFHHLLDEFSCLENALIPVSIRKGAPDKDDIAYA